jgi:hypothetical protein
MRLCADFFSSDRGRSDFPGYLRSMSSPLQYSSFLTTGDQKSNASAAAWEFAPKLATATLISADHSMGAAA